MFQVPSISICLLQLSLIKFQNFVQMRGLLKPGKLLPCSSNGHTRVCGSSLHSPWSLGYWNRFLGISQTFIWWPSFWPRRPLFSSHVKIIFRSFESFTVKRRSSGSACFDGETSQCRPPSSSFIAVVRLQAKWADCSHRTAQFTAEACREFWPLLWPLSLI